MPDGRLPLGPCLAMTPRSSSRATECTSDASLTIVDRAASVRGDLGRHPVRPTIGLVVVADAKGRTRGVPVAEVGADARSGVPRPFGSSEAGVDLVQFAAAICRGNLAEQVSSRYTPQA
jgi:hypothetical protein